MNEGILGGGPTRAEPGRGAWKDDGPRRITATLSTPTSDLR